MDFVNPICTDGFCLCAENGASLGLSSGVVEADAKQIANMARQTFAKYVCSVFRYVFFFFLFFSI